MPTKITIEKRLAFRKEALEAAQKAYLALLNGQVKSYAIGSRNLTRFDLPELAEIIANLENEVDSLETQLAGCGKRRKAVGVIPRDH